MSISRYYIRLVIIILSLWSGNSLASTVFVEPVQACVLTPPKPWTTYDREKIAQCLGWRSDLLCSLCRGSYQPVEITALPHPDEIRLTSDQASFYPTGRSQLQGNVEVQQGQRVVNAQTATIYRDPKTQQVTQIELLGGVYYREPGQLMLARTARINPVDHSGQIEHALYRFETTRANALLPAWGQASWIERFSNQNYLLKKATYSTCPPQDMAWQIEAREITLDHQKETGVARDAVLRVRDLPLLYTPYLSFPTSKKRKSGVLMPTYGYSNVGGFDVAAPYYLNLAPNYDATLVPHLYTFRGVMAGGEFRFLTDNSTGIIGGNFLPKDAAFNSFLMQNRDQFPVLQGVSSDRWSWMLHEATQFNRSLHMNINYQQVSDDYYLQDFSSNLSILTENQILRQGDLSYTTDHWLFRGMLQSYQTLHPINQSVVANVYERLPQLLAQGHYDDLPANANIDMVGQFDYFRWADENFSLPQGSRYHLEPTLALPQVKPWGYLTPAVQLIENNYQLFMNAPFINGFYQPDQTFNRLIPRYSVDSGLTFERFTQAWGRRYTQTLEPRLYYLNVPYQNQSEFPAFDSAYMIFNTDQLFRNNRFSGTDRIGDANQLAYALTSRWLAAETGREKASLTVGQISYFSKRRVQLCYRPDGQCEDSPLFLGYLSPDASTSPIASKGVYALNPYWMLSGDYVWDPATSATNNGDVNIHYQPATDRMVRAGYNYLVSGNVFLLPELRPALEKAALHQATFAYAWPFSERWSSLGIYNYNISEGYSMTSVLGIQYDTCCWAARLLGGRTFKSLLPDALTPQYNNNIYVQVLLKGFGSVSSSDPASIIQSYLPGYVNLFQNRF